MYAPLTLTRTYIIVLTGTYCLLVSILYLLYYILRHWLIYRVLCSVPSSRSEYLRIVQQLENERFPPPNLLAGDQKLAGGDTASASKAGIAAQQQQTRWRSFGQLSREEQALFEKKRLTGA